MGNNGSSSQRSGQAGRSALGGASPDSESDRGWTRSFPRDRPAARKVFPEPPNRRLRPTNNGSIIHRGGTISGRRPSSVSTLPHDLDKQGLFRGRSTSASSGVCELRPRKIDRPCRHYRSDRSDRAVGPTEFAGARSSLERFGSEPDLRYGGDAGDVVDGDACLTDQRIEGESRDRPCRYNVRKKYRAPAPPPPPHGAHLRGLVAEERRIESSDMREPRESRCPRCPRARRPVEARSARIEEALCAPPRRSRLFKTRAESKKPRVSCRSAEETLGDEAAEATEATEEARKERLERDRPGVGKGNDTLRRSMSSPEFRAELIRVAKRVRDKLEFAGKASTSEVSTSDRAGRPEIAADRATAPADRDDRVAGWTTARVPGPPSSPCPPSNVRPIAADKENSAPRRRGADLIGDPVADRSRPLVDRNWADSSGTETRPRSNLLGEAKATERREVEWRAIRGLASPERTTPKTFYFGMNELPPGVDAALPESGEIVAAPPTELAEDAEDAEEADDERPGPEDISLKLRPTLPKKRLEIPRFSPSAAWRLLSAVETAVPATGSVASEETPVTVEERIERLSRPPLPPPPPPTSLPTSLPPLPATPAPAMILLPLGPLGNLGPRSSHDKSADSGISGDAGAPNEDSFDASALGRPRADLSRPTWTPQQDLGEESSSDAGLDSPPPPAIGYPPRAHVFSLSLPRDDGRLCLFGSTEASAFGSLRRFDESALTTPRSAPLDPRRNPPLVRDLLDDNWVLSTSAPTSLQRSRLLRSAPASSSAWPPSFDPDDHRDDNVRDLDGEDDDGDRDADDDDDDDDDGDRDADDDDDDNDDDDNDDDDDDDDDDDADDDDKGTGKGFPRIMKPPSFSYLAAGGHVIYLPRSNDAEETRAWTSSAEGAPVSANVEGAGISGRRDAKPRDNPSKRRSSSFDDRVESTRKGFGDSRSRTAAERLSVFGRRRDASTEIGRRSESSTAGRRGSERTDPREAKTAKETQARPKTDSRAKRFAFQSTVRQIERRRLAEKLSREAEARERQRRGELEAMRKVEEEFQRKRAREKANIRQQLRLYSMEERLDSLPVEWEMARVSRADPDGAPSSAGSSPTSMPQGNFPAGSPQRHRRPRSDPRLCRPDYYDWSPDAASHLDSRQTTVHPKVVCDIPKSSSGFVDVGAPSEKPATSATTNVTPKSEDYRKEFAHGGVPPIRSSLASSDSEISQPNARPRSRQNGSRSNLAPSRYRDRHEQSSPLTPLVI